MRTGYPLAPLTSFRLGGPGGALPGGRLGPGPRGSVGGDRRDGASVDRHRQGVEPSRLRRRLPRAGASSRQGLPLGGPRGLRGAGGWGDAPPGPGRRGPVPRPRRPRVRGGHPGHPGRCGTDERGGPPRVHGHRRPMGGRLLAARVLADAAGGVGGGVRLPALGASRGLDRRGGRARPASRRARCHPRGDGGGPGLARATQPLAEPNCGSVFKNPEGDHAARLVEAAGAKGLSVGGAHVSEKHANFVVASPEPRPRTSGS